MAAVAQLEIDQQYSAVHELLRIFSVEKLDKYMTFHEVGFALVYVRVSVFCVL